MIKVINIRIILLFIVKPIYLKYLNILFSNIVKIIVNKVALIIKLNNIIYILTALFFAMSFIFIPEKYKIKMSQKILGLLLFIFYATSTFVLMFINWTPLDSAYIQGIQGRYFLPVMPLLFLVLAFNLDYIKPKFSNIFIRLLSIFGSRRN